MPVTYQELFASPNDENLARFLKEQNFKDDLLACQNCHKILEDDFSRDEAFQVLPTLLAEMGQDADPDTALNNFERLSRVIFSKTTFYRLLYNKKNVRDCLVRIFSTSQFLTEILIKNPEYLDWVVDDHLLRYRPSTKDMLKEVLKMIDLYSSEDAKDDALRRFHRRQLLRIGLKDLSGQADHYEIVEQLSNLADCLTEAVYKIAYKKYIQRFGSPKDEQGKEVGFVVIGMGKLGGSELNYSSDVDLLFVYGAEGKTTGIVQADNVRSGEVDNHYFFAKVAELIIAKLTQHTKEGYIFRVDMRLRPEGDTGPLVRSLDSYLNYYEMWGQNWERQALIRARAIAGQKTLGRVFINRIRSFIFLKDWEKSDILNLWELRQKTMRIVQQKGMFHRNVKAGYGGIREIEFGIQLLQLLFARRKRELQVSNTLDLLQSLCDHEVISAKDASNLTEAYIFLRRVEHMLQLKEGQQIHELPDTEFELAKIAMQLGFRDNDITFQLKNKLQQYQEIAHRFYTGLFEHFLQKEKTSLDVFHTLLDKDLDEVSLKNYLISKKMQNPYQIISYLVLIGRGSNFVNIAPETTKEFVTLCPLLVDAVAPLPNHELAFKNFEKFVSIYHGRKVFFESLNKNQKLLILLCQVFGLNPMLTQYLFQDPSLFDLLVQSDALQNSIEKGVEELQQLENSFDFKNKKRVCEFFWGLAFFLGWMDVHEYMTRLTNLANITLSRVLIKAGSEYPLKGQFSIYGLGKLGSRELGLFSDLDLIYVIDTSEDLQQVYKIVQQLNDILLNQYQYIVDTRLRIGGNDEPIVQHVDRYYQYDKARIEIWQAMAYTRIRFITGFPDQSKDLLAALSLQYPNRIGLGERDFINELRSKIAHHRNVDNKFVNFKSDPGYLLNIEFLVQFLMLPFLKRGLTTLQSIDCLRDHSILTDLQSQKLMDAYNFFRVVEFISRTIYGKSQDKLERDTSEYSIIANWVQEKTNKDLMPTLVLHSEQVMTIYKELGF